MDLSRIQQIAGAAVAAGASSAPVMRPVVPGSVLLIDGDGLNYACAGNDGTSQSRARGRLAERIKGLMQASGAEQVQIHLTYPGSNKRMRYAIATRKPYQGQRKSHKPKNWEYLRGVLQDMPEAISWGDREADDGMHMASDKWPGKVFIASEDKDLRMIPGTHIDMTTYEHTVVRSVDFDVVGANGKQYGSKWFYLQLLMGDSVDWIPGLERWVNDNGKAVKCGEKTALKLLQFCPNEVTALGVVASAYRDYYEDGWEDRLVEQAALLWLSRFEDAGDLIPYEMSEIPRLAAAEARLRERVYGV